VHLLLSGQVGALPSLEQSHSLSAHVGLPLSVGACVNHDLPPRLEANVRVRIEGLKSKSELNGLTGVIVGDCDLETGRCVVQLDSNKSLKRLQPQNIKVLDGIAPSSTDLAAYSGSVPIPAPVRASSASTSTPSKPAPFSAPPPPAINQATEWLDEDGRVCPKAVDYATQCPKGHLLVPFADGGCDVSAQRLACRVCQTSAQCERASQWLVCRVVGYCAGYAVCNSCVGAVQRAPAAIAAGESFSMLVMRAAIEFE
jgi:hypothetical protein